MNMFARVLFVALIVALATAFNAGRMGASGCVACCNLRLVSTCMTYSAVFNIQPFPPPLCLPIFTCNAGVMRAARFTLEMAKKSVGDLTEADLKGKRVFVRADFNVPLEKGKITDDTRIRGAIPTIKYLTSKGAKVMLSSHLGRPKGGYEAKFSLAPITGRLSELLGQPVPLVPDCIGVSVGKQVSEMKDGDVCLLENVRFYPEEEKNVPAFAAKLAENADLFVNDAFGTAHRAHGSTEGVATYLKPSVAGFLLQKELDYLQGAVDVPKRPFAAIVGGSKVSSKISVIEAMLNKVRLR